MSLIELTAPAKINLSLDVVGKRPDGYHLLRTVMQSIDLADRITIEQSTNHEQPERIAVITRNHDLIPNDRHNTAWKAAFVFFDELKDPFFEKVSVKLTIDKHIPVAAGLAGGSADAAAVLVGLNKLYKTNLTIGELERLAVQVGADVPFTMHGGTILCEGIGEKLTPLPAWEDLYLLLCCPNDGLLTAQVFSDYDQGDCVNHPDTERVVSAIRSRNLALLASCTANVLQPVSESRRPELKAIRQALIEQGAVLAQMSGSGPSVFGLFRSQGLCQKAANRLLQDLPDDVRIYVCRTTAAGPTEI